MAVGTGKAPKFDPPEALLAKHAELEPTDHKFFEEIAQLAHERFENGSKADLENVIKRYAKDETLDVQVAKEHFVELRKFLAVCSAAPDGLTMGMAGPVDEAWHTFIMFTVDYQKFCKLMGGSFIHHIPDVDADTSERSSKGYVSFLEIYELAFGGVAPKHIWPQKNAFLFGGGGGGCGGGGASSCGGCGSGGGGGCGQCSGCAGQGCANN